MIGIGTMRFSIYSPDSAAWKASNGSVFGSAEEYMAHLFSAERIEPRLHILEHYSLPQLERAGEGHTFRLIISTMKDLPQKYLAELRSMTDRYPFVILDVLEDANRVMNPYAVAGELLAADGHGSAQRPFGVFRLDDDDVLPADFFDQVAPYVTADHAGMMVTLGRGVTAIFDGGRMHDPRTVHHPMIAIGLLQVCKFGDDGELVRPVAGTHNLSDRNGPVILDSQRLGFFWTRHMNQDSALAVQSGGGRVEAISKAMGRYPALTMDDGFEKSFPFMAEDVDFGASHGTGSAMVWSNGVVLARRPHTYEFRTPLSAFTLMLDLIAVGPTSPNNVILTFAVESETISSDVLDLVLRGQNIARSSNESIRYFCYVTAEEGATRWTKEISLPPTVRISSVSLGLWRNAGARVSAERVDISF